MSRVHLGKVTEHGQKQGGGVDPILQEEARGKS